MTALCAAVVHSNIHVYEHFLQVTVWIHCQVFVFSSVNWSLFACVGVSFLAFTWVIFVLVVVSFVVVTTRNWNRLRLVSKKNLLSRKLHNTQSRFSLLADLYIIYRKFSKLIDLLGALLKFVKENMNTAVLFVQCISKFLRESCIFQ